MIKISVSRNSDFFHVPVRDVISRCYREGTEVSVVDILRNASCISYDANVDVTENAGLIEKIEIDGQSTYPTLVFYYECS